jgi:hypothetical protein
MISQMHGNVRAVATASAGAVGAGLADLRTLGRVRLSHTTPTLTLARLR